MPALNVVHTAILQCWKCAEKLGERGARSTVSTSTGAIILFDDADPPKQLALSFECSQGHRTKIPTQFTIELAALSPRDSPQGARVVAIGGVTASGKPLKL